MLDTTLLGPPIEVTFQKETSTLATDSDTSNQYPATTGVKLSLYLRPVRTNNQRVRVQELAGQDGYLWALQGIYHNPPNNVLPSWLMAQNAPVGRCTYSGQVGSIQLFIEPTMGFEPDFGHRFLATFTPD